MLSIGIGIGYWGTWYSCLQLEPPVVIEGAIRFLVVPFRIFAWSFLPCRALRFPGTWWKKVFKRPASHFERKSWKVDIPIFKMEAKTMFSLSTHWTYWLLLVFVFFLRLSTTPGSWLPQSRPESVGLQHMPQLCLRSWGLNPPGPRNYEKWKHDNMMWKTFQIGMDIWKHTLDQLHLACSTTKKQQNIRKTSQL